MRRKDKEIKDIHIIEDIIRKAKVCRIALSDNNIPYIVPVCFGYEDGIFYFHSAKEGRKIEIIRSNPNICIEISEDCELVTSENACDYGMRYRSVIAGGNVEFIDNFIEKQKAVYNIVRQYSDNINKIPVSSLKNIAVLKMRIDKISCKVSGY